MSLIFKGTSESPVTKSSGKDTSLTSGQKVKELERNATHTVSARVGGGFLYHTRQAMFFSVFLGEWLILSQLYTNYVRIRI